MFPTAYNILRATEEVKRDFVLTFSAQTTEVNKKLGNIFASGDIEFGTAFITLIRLALSHVQDNSAVIHKQLNDIINPLFPQVATNISLSSPISPPSLIRHNLEININNPNSTMAQNPQPIIPKMENPSKTHPKSPTTPKRVNNTENTRPIKKINKSVTRTNEIRPPQKIIPKSHDPMDVDSIDVTYHDSPQQQPINNAPVELLDNPWINVPLTIIHAVTQQDNVAHTQPKAQPCLTKIVTPESWPNVATSSNILSANDNTNVNKSSFPLQTVDDSIHSPPKNKNKNKNSQTYDARVPVSDIPGSLLSEKLNFLQGWFRGIDALKRIYVDEIFKTDYYVLQFDHLNTMRKLVRNFNEHSDAGATMTPIVYVRPTKDSIHSSPHNRCRGQHDQTFKIIDLDGTNKHIELAKEALLASTRNDVLQFLHEQPSTKELHFWINSTTYAKKLLDV